MIHVMSCTWFPVSEKQKETLLQLIGHGAFSGKERMATISWLNGPNANYSDANLLIDKARFRIDSKGGHND